MFLLTLPCAITLAQPAPGKAAPALAAALARGEPVRAIVLFQHDDVDAEARRARAAAGLRFDDERIRALRAARYRALKDAVAPSLDPADTETLFDYANLPMLALRLKSRAALERLAARPEVRAIYEDLPHTANLAQSLPLIGEPPTAAAGYAGAGTTVAVIDSGVDYTNAAFGCTAPGVPAGCKVAAAVSIANDTPPADTDHRHATNVAAIVVGAAPGARIASLDVFNNGSAYGSAILSAINWTLSNRTVYNIVALNLSLGDSVDNTSPCDGSSPFTAALQQARDAGMLAAIASGNNGFLDGMNGPACVSSAVSVGAVYDSNVGGISWGSCTDGTTAADQVTCFSNSAPFLALLAPGALITAAGLTYGGTSQAAPHVAGAIAVLRAAFPTETLAQTLARLTANGVEVTDARNGLVTPRLELDASARPPNDAFASRIGLLGASGTAAGGDALATAEPGEPAHAGAAPAASVWWTWTAPSDGQLRIDTSGSGFDTRLGVYTGTQVETLTLVAANDNAPGLGSASRVLFQAAAGTAYQIAVDGALGAAGAVTLNWSLDPAAQADVQVTVVAAPDPVTVGADLSYTMIVSNAGPQTATQVVATLSLPAAVTLKSLPAGCSAAGPAISCTIAELAPAASIQFAIVVTVDGPGSLVAQAGVSEGTPDGAPGNNSASATTLAKGGQADVPLPAWSLAAMATLLAGALWRRERRAPRA